MPSWVDIEGIVAHLALIDRWAREAGRDPAAVDTVLRVDIDAGTSTGHVADAVKAVQEGTGFDHVMVETTYAIETADEAVQHAVELIGLVARG